MNATLTFRMDSEKRKKLREKARNLGKTESEFIREILDRELEERPIGARLQHVKGQLAPPEQSADDSWRRSIKERNWRE